MSRRNYSQYCGLAHALDVVGERWTLLIVRELGSGPKRYTQLADTLVGIGTSLLATRIRQLEADGIVQRRLAVEQPSSTVLYELAYLVRPRAKTVATQTVAIEAEPPPTTHYYPPKRARFIESAAMSREMHRL